MPTRHAAATAPATVSNVGPGFDALGFAVEGPTDRADVTVVPATSSNERFTATVTEITPGDGISELPPIGESNTAAIAARETLRLANVPGHVEVHLRKGLPVGTGLGSSAASAVASAFATNAAIGSPLRRIQLIEACLAAEEAAAGRHADNAAPALLGGLVLVRRTDPTDIVRLPVPKSLRVAVVSPRLSIMTRDARAVVPTSLPTPTAIHHAADLASLVAACYAGDFDLLARSMNDAIAEPARLPLITGAADALNAMRRAGALGASISGSGPALFAWCRSDESAQHCGRAAVQAFAAHDVSASAFTSSADRPGARLA